MKIILDLNKSMNNHELKNKKELETHLNNIFDTLWGLYHKLDEEEKNSLYDLLDMFRNYEIKE